MYCTKCGHNSPPGSTICGKCGESLTGKSLKDIDDVWEQQEKKKVVSFMGLEVTGNPDLSWVQAWVPLIMVVLMLLTIFSSSFIVWNPILLVAVLIIEVIVAFATVSKEKPKKKK
jgi:uncharacterized membrane protein YvbJ